MKNNNNPEEDMANEQEINRKRKSISPNNNFQTPRSRFSDNLQEHDDENDVLTLSLSFRPPTRHRSNQLPPSPPQSVQSLLSQPPTHNALQLSSSHPLYENPFPQGLMQPELPPPVPGLMQPELTPSVPVLPPQPRPSGPTRTRRNPTQAPRDGKTEIIPQPYPWATTCRATVHSLAYLESEQIVTITGDLQCKRCEKQYEMDFDLREKFYEVGSFIVKNRGTMHDRAPSVWMNPILPACKFCNQENSVKPIISEKKKAINWLFLLLGQMLGCCTLEQLKYFCKHTKNHRTGAKDRVLYLTYLGICKQLDPKGPFDR